MCQPLHSKDGNDVTETYCSEKEWKNPDVNIGTWVNTNAQVLDFTFQLDVPIHSNNAMYIAGLYWYSRYPESYGEPGMDYWDPAYDYDYYMNELNESSKYEVHFKCVKEEEPTPEPTPELTTLEQSTTNSFYVNGLDQEYLT